MALISKPINKTARGRIQEQTQFRRSAALAPQAPPPLQPKQNYSILDVVSDIAHQLGVVEEQCERLHDVVCGLGPSDEQTPCEIDSLLAKTERVRTRLSLLINLNSETIHVLGSSALIDDKA